MQPIAGKLNNGVGYRFSPTSIESEMRIRGQLKISEEIEPEQCDYPEFVDVIGEDWSDGVIDIELGTAGGFSGTILLKMDEEFSIPIVNSFVYYSINEVLNGDTEEAIKCIKQNFDTTRWDWKFRRICKNRLQFEPFVDIINTLAGNSDRFAHTQFRSGIGYFAKRINDDIPQAISSFPELKERIDYWNSKTNMKSVSLPDVIGEQLGRDWYRDEFGGERNELIDIGFDPLTFNPNWDTFVPACWIAHLTLSNGIDEAKQFVKERPSPSAKEYQELKKDAEQADDNLCSRWGDVVANTFDQSDDDFRWDVFNYLMKTADGYRGKAKFSPLLYAGADTVALSHFPTDMRQNVEFNREIAIGHNWRRDKNVEAEKNAFERAKRIARGAPDGYEFDPFLFVEAEASLTNAVAKTKSDSEKSVRLYETAIRNIDSIGNEYQVPEWQIDDKKDFLEDMLERVNHDH